MQNVMWVGGWSARLWREPAVFLLIGKNKNNPLAGIHKTYESRTAKSNFLTALAAGFKCVCVCMEWGGCLVH